MAKYGVVPLSNFLLVADEAADVVACTTGFNTLTRPAGMDGAVIIPDPTTPDVTLTLKGETTDVGLLLSSNIPSIVACAADIGLTVSDDTNPAVRWFRVGTSPAVN